MTTCGLGSFAYNCLGHVSSLKMIDFHAKMVHIFDAIYDFGFEHTWICYVDSKQNQRVGYEEPRHSPNDVNYLKQKSALNCDPLQQIRMPPNPYFELFQRLRFDVLIDFDVKKCVFEG